MPLTKQDISDVNSKCTKIWSNILNYGGNVVYVPDGTIYADIANGNGTFTNYEITQTCCKILAKSADGNPNTPSNVNPQNIYFDLDEQKCRWSEKPKNACSTENTPIKIVLNPVGNDGAFFTLTENDTCSLKVKFNYLFKINCEVLKDIISGPAANPSFNVASNDELLILRQSKFELESNSFDINNELDNLVQQNAKLNYSIVCNEFPTNDEVLQSTPETKISASQTLPFNNTGFGSLTNTTDLSLTNTKVGPVYKTKTVNFCLTEIGLDSWRQVIGEDNYSGFINGVADSYTCLDVVSIYELNKTALLNNQPELLFECNTPFGEKTRTLNRIEELSKLKIENKTKQDNVDVKIKNITDIKDTNACSTLLGQFENLSATVTLDMINDDGTTTQFYSQTLFNQIGNLYNYLSENTDNSGFLVCGEASETETWTSGCTGLIYPEFTNGVLTVDPESDNINVSICQIVKDTLYSELYNNSGLASTSDFNQSLSPNAFNSNWLTFETTPENIDQAIITGITNNKIKLNVIINSSCGNLCLLVDQINMTKVCEDANRTNIFISQSPGFNLTRVIDNKKSWLQADSYTERDFHIGNYNDANQIRQTEYTVDEERLILNTKEIDLTMNMASAIENDVWCYLVDNPNLLTGQTCSSNTGLTPTDIYGNPIILPTAQTLTDVSVIIGKARNYLDSCIAANYPKIDICYPEIENQVCGDTLKILLDNGDGSLWVTCQYGQLGFYYISANTNTQNTIFNITQSTLDPISLRIDLFKLRVSDNGGVFYSEDCLSDILVNFVFNGSSLDALTAFMEVINDFIVQTNSDHPLYEPFWNSDGTCNFCNNTCGDKRIDFSGFMSTNISEIKTLESFDDLMTSELIDVKNRKTLSSYPSLRAVYDRYMDATEYGLTNSNEFDYYKMDQFTSLVKTYWDDLIEQVVPSTTIWGNVKVYTNTLFDQQKFKYRSYSSLLCNNPLNFVSPPSPINGSEGQCEDVEVVTYNLQVFPSEQGGPTLKIKPVKYNSICLTQMNWGSEFVGNVDIRDGRNNDINNDSFCNTCDKNIRWYNMVDRPEFIMEALVCYPIGTTAVTFSISALTVNGTSFVTTPLSSTTMTPNNVNFVRAENNIISGCTSGGITGWTYTNFVDFLNDTFTNLGLTEYKAIISLKEKQGVGNECSMNGFYISYPKNDAFSIVIQSDSDVSTICNYTNIGLLLIKGNKYYYCSTADNIDYDCLKNIVNE
jgi:hypothetical protein